MSFLNSSSCIFNECISEAYEPTILINSEDIVDIETGKVVGEIVDILLEFDGKLEGLIVEKKKFLISNFSSKDEFLVKWDQVKKIGEDVILVKIENKKE